MSLPIAIQLFSIRDEMAADLPGTLKKIKEMGYSGVELAGTFYGLSPEEFKAELDRAGLVAISAHMPLQDMRVNIDQVISDCKAIGCEYIVVPYLPPADRKTEEDFLNVVKDIHTACTKVAEAGMTMLYHNHDFEFEKIGDQYRLDYLYDNVPSNLLQTELDLCWVRVGGENPATYLQKYADKAPLIHLKDFVGGKSESMYELIGIKSEAKKSTGTFEFRPIGYGCQDWYTILCTAQNTNAKWLIVEQDNATIGLTPMESAAMSRAYLKTLGY